MSQLIDYLEKKRAEDNSFRQKQLDLEREKFEASRAERDSMLQLMAKMMDKLK